VLHTWPWSNDNQKRHQKKKTSPNKHFMLMPSSVFSVDKKHLIHCPNRLLGCTNTSNHTQNPLNSHKHHWNPTPNHHFSPKKLLNPTFSLCISESYIQPPTYFSFFFSVLKHYRLRRKNFLFSIFLWYTFP